MSPLLPPTPLESPCLEYRGPLTAQGYGKIRVVEDGRRVYRHVHRRVMEMAEGRRLGSDEVVMHRCDNRRCFRFDHLAVGSQLDNVRDRDAKGRAARGERHGRFVPPLYGPPAPPGGASRVLTVGQVQGIKRQLRSGERKTDIAKRYGVHRNTVSDISSGRIWKWVVG